MIKVIKKYKTIITLGFLATLSLGVFFYTQAQGGGQTSSSPNLQKGLVGHWTLSQDDYNASTNEIKDLSPYGNHGTNYGATFTADRHNKDGGAMGFNGSDNISITNPLNQSNLEQEWSVSAWVNILEGPNQTLINSGFNRGLHLNYSTTNRMLLYLNAGDNDYYVYSNATNLLVNLGWKHVVFVFRNSDGFRKIFVDGVDKSGTGPNKTFTPSGISSTLQIGAGLIGSISDLRVYNRAITEEEISLLYESYKPQFQASSLERGLIGHWEFNEDNYNSITNEFKDLSVFGNHLTNYGASLIQDRLGNDNSAISLNGSSNYLLSNNNLNRNINSGDWTASVWYYINTAKPFDSWKTVFGTDINYTTGFNIFERRVCSYTTDAYAFCVNFDASMNPYQWHLVTAVHNYNTKTISAFLDGQYVGQASYPGTLVDTANRKLGLGRRSTTNYFNGNISEARLYNRALSQEEISQLYESHKPKLEISSLSKGLVLDMPLTSSSYNENSSRVDDRSVYGNHGVNNGGVVTDGYTYLSQSSSHFISVPHDESINFTPEDSFSVAASFSLDEHNGGERWSIFLKGSGVNSYGISGRWQNLNIGYRSAISSIVVLSYPIEMLRQYHVVMVVDNNEDTMTLYIDGQFVSNRNIDFNAANASSWTSFHTNGIAGSAGLAGGKIKNLKIYNRALTAEEVNLLYSIDK